MSDDRRRDRLSPRNVALSDEAIDWVVRLSSGFATPEDRAAFDAWRNRSPAHADAAAEAAAILSEVGETCQSAEYREIGAALRSSAKTPAHRFSRRAVIAGGVVTASAAALVGSGTFGPLSGLLSDYATGVGRRRRVVLQDGSVAWLNTSTALSANFSERERQLTLHAGEALFEVTKDRHRPFIVASGDGEVRALGTVYSVRQHGAINDVVVTEGSVEVRNGSQTTRLTAGEQMAYGAGFKSAVRAVDSEALTSWSRGKLIFNHRPLGEVADELERYQYGKVIVRGEDLKRLEVTGVFDLDDNTALLRAISATVNVPITRLPLITLIG